jgi:hypothetical protein
MYFIGYIYVSCNEIEISSDCTASKRKKMNEETLKEAVVY